ncbi:MAG: DUF1810 domain-containing protein [Bacteroidota bacterium]
MYNLQLFLTEQDKDYQTALNEIKFGCKQTHWIWYVFPQLDGLVAKPSDNTKKFSIKNRNEAIAYYKHPILRTRLREITQELLKHKNKNIQQIMDEVDSVKLRSCMTLFDYISSDETSLFREVLDQYFSGQVDQKTIEILKNEI